MSQVLYFLLFLVIILVILLFLHSLRLRNNRGPFIFMIGLLWFFSYLFGHLGVSINLGLTDGFILEVRYSSAFFTMIFAAILLVYICEGTREARILILSSILAQVFIVAIQLFMHYPGASLIRPLAYESAVMLFSPSYRLFASIGIAIIDLFFAVFFFQFLVNRFKTASHALLLLFALFAAMTLDSVLYVSITENNNFTETLLSHLIVKGFISALVTVPIQLYLNRLKQLGGLTLKRGSLDIFRRIEDLEGDLEIANRELREYANKLEQKVEERTHEIKEKQALLDFELEMAATVQASMLPAEKPLEKIDVAVEYRPCSRVSGDLYQMGMLNDNDLYILIADISGHGVSAGLVGAMVNMSLSKMDFLTMHPAEVLQRISTEIEPLRGAHYLTAVFLKISLLDREIRFSNGAHVSPILISPGKKILRLEPTGGIIGVEEFANFQQKKARYSQQTRLVLFTDCIVEHKNEQGEEFSEGRLIEILLSTASLDVDHARGEVLAGLQKFNPLPYSDDLTLIIIDLP